MYTEDSTPAIDLIDKTDVPRLKSKYTMTPLAAAVIAALSPANPALAQDVDDDLTIDEILVTATKRTLNLQDVPQSIQAFSQDSIEKMVFKSMEDYMKAIPSATLTNSMPGRNQISMRGISTGSSEFHVDSKVAVYLDEQPITSVSQQPEVRMVDIARIESLPGPQGTLFGSSAQAGTLRIITNKPNFDGFSGQGDFVLAGTKGGDESFDVSGVLNIPLIEDKLAIRIVGFSAKDGGYVDNIVGPTLAGPGAYGSPGDNSAIAKDNQNIYRISGGRIAALWNINDDWQADFSYIAQNSKADGTWESDPYLGDHKITRFFEEYRNDDWWQLSTTFRGDLGFAEFVSTTSWFERDSAYEWDNHEYNQWMASYYGVYWGWVPYDFEYEFGTTFNVQLQNRFAQEFRLTSQGDSKLQWMLGAFYEDVYDTWFYGNELTNYMQTNGWEAINYYACWYAANGYDAPCPIPDTTKPYTQEYKNSVKQTAVFGEMSYDLAEDFTVSVGARWFEYDRDVWEEYAAPQNTPPPGSYGRGEGIFSSAGKSSDTTFKFSSQWRATDDAMVYFTYSEGFRLGGYNSQKAVDAAGGLLSPTYDPDKLINYEFGIKSEWLNNSVQLNASVFSMQWEGIQLWADLDGPWWLNGMLNGKSAESKGMEINGSWRVSRNLTLEGSAFFAKAQITSDIFDLRDRVIAADGQQMPGSPKKKNWLAAEYTVPGAFGMAGDLWFRYDVSYMGSSWDTLSGARNNDPLRYLPAWSSSNLQVGFSFDNDLTISLMARNLTDEHGMTATWDQDYISNWFGDPRWQQMPTLQRPRTISLNIRKKF